MLILIQYAKAIQSAAITGKFGLIGKDYTCRMMGQTYKVDDKSVKIYGKHSRKKFGLFKKGYGNKNVTIFEASDLKNNIQKVPSPIFKLFVNLRELHMVGTNLKVLDGNSFTNCKNLKKTIFGKDHIESISAGVFEPCLNLEVLEFNGNVIDKINNDAFKGLTNLRTLKLNGNNFATINPTLFAPLKGLTELTITNNPIVKFHPDSFLGMPNLRLLDLSHNHLAFVSSLLFRFKNKLQHVNLSQNAITTVEHTVFQNWPNHATLNMTHNTCVNKDFGPIGTEKLPMAQVVVHFKKCFIKVDEKKIKKHPSKPIPPRAAPKGVPSKVIPVDGHPTTIKGHEVPAKGHATPVKGHEVPAKTKEAHKKGHAVTGKNHPTTAKGHPSPPKGKQGPLPAQPAKTTKKTEIDIFGDDSKAHDKDSDEMNVKGLSISLSDSEEAHKKATTKGKAAVHNVPHKGAPPKVVPHKGAPVTPSHNTTASTIVKGKKHLTVEEMKKIAIEFAKKEAAAHMHKQTEHKPTSKVVIDKHGHKVIVTDTTPAHGKPAHAPPKGKQGPPKPVGKAAAATPVKPSSLHPYEQSACRFYINAKNEYICVLRNVASTLKLINTEHLKGHVNKDVTVLYIRDANLITIPKVIFTTFPNLVKLSVGSSGLKIMDSDLFEVCGKLKHLDLANNKIEVVRGDSLKKCKSLETVDLSKNPVERIESKIFSNNPKLSVALGELKIVYHP